MPMTESDIKLTMVSLPGSRQEENICGLIKSNRTKNYKICYLLFRTPFLYMYNELEKRNLLANLNVIDLFGGKYNLPQNKSHITSLSGPSISEILSSINNTIRKNNCNVILVDTIDELLHYHPRHEIQRLTNCLKTDNNYKDTKKIFLFSKDNELVKEEANQLFNDLQFYADKIILNNFP
jgi:archaellum biogenesis ATPase FlaH